MDDREDEVQEHEISIFSDSFERALADPRFFDVFYEDFLQNPEVVAKFENTNFVHQKRALKQSLYIAMWCIVRRQGDFSWLEDVAKVHDREHRDIEPALYDMWLESLLRTVACCDRFSDERTLAVWRQAMGQAARFMASRH